MIFQSLVMILPRFSTLKDHNQSGEVPNWDARLRSLVAIATYTLPIRHVTSSSAIDLLSACAICWIYGKGLRLAREFSFLLAVEF